MTTEGRVEALERLARAAPLYGDAHLQTFVDRYFATCAPEAVEVALRTGEPLASLLTRSVEKGVDPRTAEELVELVPTTSASLRRFSVICLRRALSRRSVPRNGGKVRRARLLHRLAYWLDVSGELPEAEAAARKAVSLYRQLEGVPEDSRAALAMALVTHSEILARLGRRHYAARQARGAVAELEILHARAPDAYSDALVVSLRTLASRRAVQGEQCAAVAVSYRALRLARGVHLKRLRAPGERSSWHESAYLDLAYAHQDLASQLADFGRVRRALCHQQAAGSRFREKVVWDGYRPLLAAALTEEAALWSKLKQPRDAAPPLKEACDIYRELACRYPEGFTDRYCAALSNLSSVLLSLQDTPGAYRTSRRAAVMARHVFRKNAGLHLYTYAAALLNYANCLSSCGRDDEALVALRAAKRAFSAGGERGLEERELEAKCDAHLAHVLIDLDDPRRALKHARRAVARYDHVRRGVATDDSANALNVLAAACRGTGRLDEGLAAAERAVSAYAWLEVHEDASFAASEAIAQHCRAGIVADMGRWEQAKPLFREALAGLLLAARRDAAYERFLEDAMADYVCCASVYECGGPDGLQGEATQ